MLTLIRKLRGNTEGATAIEYGLIAALVSLAGIVVFQTVGGEINEIFTSVEGDLDTASTQEEGANAQSGGVPGDD